MATTVTITQTLKGKDAGKLFHAMLMEVDILASGLIQVIEDANTPIYLNRIEVSPEIVRYSCGFDPKGSINMTEKKIIVEKYKIEMEVCKEDFRNSSIGSQFGESAWNKNMSQDLNDAVEAYCVNAAQNTINDWIWNGKKGNGIEFDGYFEQFKTDAEVIKVKATDTPTTENVTAIFKKVKKSFTKIMRKNKMITGFFVSSDIFDAYETLLINKGIDNGFGGDANTYMKYGKIEIHEMIVFPENTIVAVLDKNLAFATGLLQDYNEFIIRDGDEGTKPDGKIYFKMVFGAGCGYVFGGDIIWYGEDVPEAGTGDVAGRSMMRASAPVEGSKKTTKTVDEVVEDIKLIEDIDELDLYDSDTRKGVINAVSKRRAELEAGTGDGAEDDLDALVGELGGE